MIGLRITVSVRSAYPNLFHVFRKLFDIYSDSVIAAVFVMAVFIMDSLFWLVHKNHE